MAHIGAVIPRGDGDDPLHASEEATDPFAVAANVASAEKQGEASQDLTTVERRKQWMIGRRWKSLMIGSWLL